MVAGRILPGAHHRRSCFARDTRNLSSASTAVGRHRPPSLARAVASRLPWRVVGYSRVRVSACEEIVRARGESRVRPRTSPRNVPSCSVQRCPHSDRVVGRFAEIRQRGTPTAAVEDVRRLYVLEKRTDSAQHPLHREWTSRDSIPSDTRSLSPLPPFFLADLYRRKLSSIAAFPSAFMAPGRASRPVPAYGTEASVRCIINCQPTSRIYWLIRE